jgi:hypothetical protein
MNQEDVSALVSLIKSLDASMLGEAEWEALGRIDVRDRALLGQALEESILPEYLSWDALSRRHVQVALARSATSSGNDLAAVLRQVEMPFAPAVDPHLFFDVMRDIVARHA